MTQCFKGEIESEAHEQIKRRHSSFASLAFDLSLKGLRHSFAITKEAAEEGLFISVGGGWGYTTSWDPCAYSRKQNTHRLYSL